MPYLLFLFICMVWGGSFILMDRASLAVGPLAIGLCRLLGGAVFLGLYALARRHSLRVARRDWLHVLFVGVVANAYPFVIQPYVMARAGEHAYFGMMVTLVPLATILASIPLLGIWPTWRQTVGVLAGLACIGVVVVDGLAREISPGLILLALTVPISYAVGNTYIRWKLPHMAPLALTFAFLTLGGAVVLPLQFSTAALAALDMQGPAEPSGWVLALVALMFLAVVSTGIAVLIFIHLVQTQGPLFAGMVTYVVPVAALAWGQFDEELLTSRQLVAMAGILASVAVVQWGSAARSTVRPDSRVS
jgi:drug/metabolite transporter (DMT)-like permease